MGSVPEINYDNWPRQSADLGARVKVCFHYDTSQVVDGIVARDDAEAPHETIISLDDGRLVRSVECMYQVVSS